MDNYKERLVEEYVSLLDRYISLYSFLVDYEAGKVNVQIKDIDLLYEQRDAMDAYLSAIEARAEAEDVTLPQ